MAHVWFTTPGVGRVFLGCDRCPRVVPHYQVYGPHASGRCRCGSTQFRPRQIPEWRAAWWLLVVGWLWRKTLCRAAVWDPRLPVRTT